jgi:hypothetical protein
MTSAFTELKHAETMGKVQVAVAKKVSDQDKANGAAAIQLLNAATHGVNKAAEGVGAAMLGRQLDVLA